MDQQKQKVDAPVLTNPSHAMSIIQGMMDNRGVVASPSNVIQNVLGKIRERVTYGEPALPFGMSWKNIFRDIGEAAIRLTEAHFEMVYTAGDAHAMAYLLEAKGKRYGPKPIRSWGELGVIIRIDSKFQRFLHMIESEDDGAGTDEPLLDTLRDILGYCVLGYALVSEKNV